MKIRYAQDVILKRNLPKWNAIFSRTFAAGNKIKQFYELLVEDSLRREDVDSLSRENMKNLHEIMQSFRFSNVRNAIATNLNIDFGQKRSNLPPNAVFLIAKFL